MEIIEKMIYSRLGFNALKNEVAEMRIVFEPLVMLFLSKPSIPEFKVPFKLQQLQFNKTQKYT